MRRERALQGTEGRVDNIRSKGRAWGLVGALMLIAGLGLVGCRQEATKPAAQVPVVETVQVAQRDVPVQREWVGVLDGMVNATIRPQVSGYLVRQNYKEGETVRKGQALFEIDPRPFQVALNKAKAQLSQQIARHATSEANLARIRPLAAKNAVSQKDLDDAIGTELSTRSAVEGAQAAVEEAQLNLGFTKVSSPVDGVAGIAKTQLGDLVGPSMQNELTSVSTLDPIKAYINISEREYLSAAAAGKQVEQLPLELILGDGQVYPHPGHFAIMDRQVDPTTGTLKIGILFPNPNNMLRPGQYARVRATVRMQLGALLVPQRAVSEIQGRYLLAVVAADNKIEVRPVQVGARIGSDWIIEKGLKPGEQVVVEGVQKVRPGMVVTPKPFQPAAPPTPQTQAASATSEKR